MNPYIKGKLSARKPGAPGQLTAADFGELAFSYLKRRQNAGKAEIKPFPGRGQRQTTSAMSGR